MLYYKNLYSLFFDQYPKDADDFIALSGFVGPNPIKDLSALPFRSQVVYGLFKENQKKKLHDQLTNIHNDKIQVYYSDILCHSKCYLWLKDSKPIRGLIGSANFSSNGLLNDYRETLFAVDDKQLFALKGYIDLILNSSNACVDYSILERRQESDSLAPENLSNCDMVLYDPKTGEVPTRSGLNWGMNPKNHVRPNDAYISIKADYIRKYRNLFPPKQSKIEGRKRQNEVVEIIWDDGESFKGLLEGTITINGIVFPKQISSHPNKDSIGKYIRNRLNVPLGTLVTMDHLRKYGRNNISVSLLEEGVYFFDFSV